MKAMFVFLAMLFSFSLMSQITISVHVNGAPAEGVGVFFFSQKGKFFVDGLNKPPRIQDFFAHRFTDANGEASSFIWSDPTRGTSVGDTVFYATKDCNGNLVYGGTVYQQQGFSITDNLNLNCVPGDCDVQMVFKPVGQEYLVGAYFLREFAQTTSLPDDTSEVWIVNGTTYRPHNYGFGRTDTLPYVNWSSLSRPITVEYTRSAGVCSPTVIGSTGQINCNAAFYLDTTQSSVLLNQLVVLNTAFSSGNIISYTWDFGDGTIKTGPFPSHTYANAGVYYVCLTIEALSPSATDTCVTTFCDSLGIDANGNMIFKNAQNGFTINVVDPNLSLLESPQLDQVEMFPNPAKGKVMIKWDAKFDIEKINVFSITGQQVKSIAVIGDELEIRDLPSGAYLVCVESATASKTLRLIVE